MDILYYEVNMSNQKFLGPPSLFINYMFYRILEIKQGIIARKIKMYFDEKDITVDINFSQTDYTYINMYFFKDKTLKEYPKMLRHDADVSRDITCIILKCGMENLLQQILTYVYCL